MIFSENRCPLFRIMLWFRFRLKFLASLAAPVRELQIGGTGLEDDPADGSGRAKP
jgi:hypothetical protein